MRSGARARKRAVSSVRRFFALCGVQLRVETHVKRPSVVVEEKSLGDKMRPRGPGNALRNKVTGNVCVPALEPRRKDERKLGEGVGRLGTQDMAAGLQGFETGPRRSRRPAAMFCFRLLPFHNGLHYHQTLRKSSGVVWCGRGRGWHPLFSGDWGLRGAGSSGGRWREEGGNEPAAGL